jgi:fluoride exporter
MRNIHPLILVMVGGAFGAATRYVLIGWLVARWGSAFPGATLFINATGSMLLGLFLMSQPGQSDENTRLLIATGFFGAYTTYSTFAVETVALFNAGNIRAALLNVLLTNSLCILAAFAGMWLGGRLPKP